jgi:pimeloyl-ACP methyl ester carboxylesterase
MREYTHPMQPQDLDLVGGRVHFWKGGDGPGLLLLHAAWGDAEMSWSRVWDPLSRTFTVIAPDLPGFGRSAGQARPSLSAMATTLKQLLDSLHMDRVIVVGNSFGAGVAIQLANEHAKAIAQIVIVNGGYMPAIPDIIRKLISLPVLNTGFRSLVRKLAYSASALNRSFVDPSKLPPRFFENIQLHALAYSRISFDTIMNMAEPLARPAVPVLLLWGAQDGLATLKQAQAIQRTMPGAELITIEGAGHMPQMERPDEFIAVIKNLRDNR